MKKLIVALIVRVIFTSVLASQVQAVEYDYRVESAVTIALTAYIQDDETCKDTETKETCSAKVLKQKITNQNIIDTIGEYNDILFSKKAVLIYLPDQEQFVVRDGGMEYEVDDIGIYFDEDYYACAYTWTENYDKETYKGTGTCYSMMNFDLFGNTVQGFTTTKYKCTDMDTCYSRHSAKVSGNFEMEDSEGVLSGTIKMTGKLIKVPIE
jgi:hypothetical protein